MLVDVLRQGTGVNQEDGVNTELRTGNFSRDAECFSTVGNGTFAGVAQEVCRSEYVRLLIWSMLVKNL